MDENFDHLIDPPNQARNMVIGVLLAGAALIISFIIWYYLVHTQTTDSLDHQGHFSCLLLYENPIFFAAGAFAFIVWASGKFR